MNKKINKRKKENTKYVEVKNIIWHANYVNKANNE